MIREKFLFKHYKSVMAMLIVVGAALFLLGNLAELEFVKGYTQGIGFGLVGAGLVNTIIIMIKKRNSDYVEEMEMSFQDERVQLAKMKSMAYAGGVAIAELIVFSMLNVYIGFELLYGITIVLFSYAVALGSFKLYFKNR